MFKPLLSRIMREAHARAREDFAWSKANERTTKPYSYYLGLQMRSGYAEARAALTGMVTVTSFARDVQGALRSSF
jgi:hypothetical protein